MSCAASSMQLQSCASMVASIEVYERLVSKWHFSICDSLQQVLRIYIVLGICAHVDLMRFEDGIAIVSLESSCVMHFSRVESEVCHVGKEAKSDPPPIKIPVYLTPGSLVLMWGEARYLWKHEINRKPGFQKWERQDIDQKRRTSITLRKLCQSE